MVTADRISLAIYHAIALRVINTLAHPDSHLNNPQTVSFVTLSETATQRPALLTFRLSRAMLPSTVSIRVPIQLTGGVSIDYTANLRCTRMSSARS